jgi:phosphonopyruvate decarboxylase
MIESDDFFHALTENGVTFYAGVPDSLLRDFISYLLEHTNDHVITANEGAAIALAAGHYLASGFLSLVYLQNSGLGNAVNPLISLIDREVYGLPVILLIGWRGQPGVPDEPQHVKQGRITPKLLETLEIPYAVLPNPEASIDRVVANGVETARRRSAPYALLVRRNAFVNRGPEQTVISPYELSREDAVAGIVRGTPPGTAFVATTGMLARELFECRERARMGHDQDFLNVGAMGHASQIALGIALRGKSVCCLDGDGAAIMHMGAFAIVGQQQPKSFIHVVINNGAHASVGGQPTAGFAIDFPQIARACGYRKALRADTLSTLQTCLCQLRTAHGPVMLEVRVHTGSRPDLGRPTIAPHENKQTFMRFLGK